MKKIMIIATLVFTTIGIINFSYAFDAQHAAIVADIKTCSLLTTEYRSCQTAVQNAQEFGITDTEIIEILTAKFRSEVNGMRILADASAHGKKLSSEELRKTINQIVDQNVKTAMSLD